MKFKSLLLGAALLGVPAGSASAALVTAWNWETLSVFTVQGAAEGVQTVSGNVLPGSLPTWTTPTFVPGQASSTTRIEATAGRISWGSTLGSLDPAANAARSGITWVGPAVGTPPVYPTAPFTTPRVSPPQLLTNLGFRDGSAATHFNQPIDISFATLSSGLIHTFFNLYKPPNAAPLPPNAGNQGSPEKIVTRDFTFVFVETPNSGGGWGGSGCVPGTPNTPTPGGAGCADLFLLVPDPTNPLTETFVFEGDTYTLQVGAFDGPQSENPNLVLVPQNHAVCGFAQIQANPTLAALCLDPNFQPVGFQTPENANTTIQFAFAITGQATPISEPSTLALFGAALLGLGLFNLRRRSV